MEGSAMTKRIRDWMYRVMESRSYLSFDDLHIDEISDRFVGREVWVRGAVEALQAAVLIRNAEQLTFTIAAGFSLHANSTPTGLMQATLLEIDAELDQSPPSLYLFERQHEPWITDNDFRELDAGFYPRVNVPVRAFLREWYDDNDADFRRSFWLAA